MSIHCGIHEQGGSLLHAYLPTSCSIRWDWRHRPYWTEEANDKQWEMWKPVKEIQTPQNDPKLHWVRSVWAPLQVHAHF
jgi:hypothetical protein